MKFAKSFLLRSFFILIFGLVWSEAAFAAPRPQSSRTFTYQARFLNADGTRVLQDPVDIKFGIYDPSGTYLLYEEKQASIDLEKSQGRVVLQVGSPLSDAKRTASDPGNTMEKVFDNSVPITPGYTPSLGDQRRLKVTVTSLVTLRTAALTPDLTLSPVPQSIITNTLGGLAAESFVQISGSPPAYVLPVASVNAVFSGPGDASQLHTHDSIYLSKSGGSLGASLSTILVSDAQGLVLQGASSQSASLQEWKDSSGANVASFSPTGALSISGALTVSALSGGYLTSASTFGDSSMTWSTAGIIPTSSLNYTSCGSSSALLKAGGSGGACSLLVAGELPALAGDLVGAYSSPSVVALRGFSVASTGPTTGQVLKYNVLAQQWQPGADLLGGQITSVTAGTGLTGGVISTSGTLALANTAVSAGSYLNADITVDGYGRLTAAQTGRALNLGTADVTGSLPLSGDVTGTHTAAVVGKIQAVNVLGTASVVGARLRYNSQNTRWEQEAAVALSGTTVAPDGRGGEAFVWNLTAGSSSTLSAPTNFIMGRFYTFIFVQPSSGGAASVSFDPKYINVTCTVNVTMSTTSVCTYYFDGTNLRDIGKYSFLQLDGREVLQC